MSSLMPALVFALHVLSAVIWVGGMFFAYMALRPVAATLLEPPQRLPLWDKVFARFFLWVWVAVALLPTTGFWMIFKLFTDLSTIGPHVHIMTGLGILMILIFMFVYYVPYLRLRLALLDGDLPKAGKHLGTIRQAIGLNLLIGLAVIVVASAGRYL